MQFLWENVTRCRIGKQDRRKTNARFSRISLNASDLADEYMEKKSASLHRNANKSEGTFSPSGCFFSLSFLFCLCTDRFWKWVRNSRQASAAVVYLQQHRSPRRASDALFTRLNIFVFLTALSCFAESQSFPQRGLRCVYLTAPALYRRPREIFHTLPAHYLTPIRGFFFGCCHYSKSACQCIPPTRAHLT